MRTWFPARYQQTSRRMITRRAFTKLAASAVAMSTTPLCSATNKLDVGIGTYSYHNLSMDDMIVQLKASKVQVIEMSRGEFMLMNHPSEGLFASAREKLDRAGIRCASYYSATIKT